MMCGNVPMTSISPPHPPSLLTWNLPEDRTTYVWDEPSIPSISIPDQYTFVWGNLANQKTKTYYPTKMSSFAYHLSTAESDAISTINRAFWVIFAVPRLLPPSLPPTPHRFALSMTPMARGFKSSFLSS